MTFSIRHFEPTTRLGWIKRYGLLEFVREVEGGLVARCPKCGWHATWHGLFLDESGQSRLFVECDCGHFWERTGRQ